MCKGTPVEKKGSFDYACVSCDILYADKNIHNPFLLTFNPRDYIHTDTVFTCDTCNAPHCPDCAPEDDWACKG